MDPPRMAARMAVTPRAPGGSEMGWTGSTRQTGSARGHGAVERKPVALVLRFAARSFSKNDQICRDHGEFLCAGRTPVSLVSYYLFTLAGVLQNFDPQERLAGRP